MCSADDLHDFEECSVDGIKPKEIHALCVFRLHVRPLRRNHRQLRIARADD
jgi:hypothetical protein